MPTNQSYYVSSEDGKLRRKTGPDREYFVQYGSDDYGVKKDKAKYLIEVFGNNHDATAKKVYKMIENSPFKDNLFRIKVETRD